MGSAGESHIRVKPLLAEGIELVKQRFGIDHTAVAQHTDLPADRPAWNQ